MDRIDMIKKWLTDNQPYATFIKEEINRRTSAQMKRCVRAIVSKSGDSSRESISRAFAICTASLQSKGYLKKGSNEPTAKGKKRSKSKAAEKGHSDKVADYEAMLALAKKR